MHAELDYLLDNDRMAIRERNLFSYLVTPKRFHSAELRLLWKSYAMFAEVCMCAGGQLLSHDRLFVTPWTVARQAPLCMGFSRKEYWSALPFPPGEGLSSQPKD